MKTFKGKEEIVLTSKEDYRSTLKSTLTSEKLQDKKLYGT